MSYIQLEGCYTYFNEMNLDEDFSNLGRINKSIYESNIEAFMGAEMSQDDRESVLGLGKLITDMQEK